MLPPKAEKKFHGETKWKAKGSRSQFEQLSATLGVLFASPNMERKRCGCNCPVLLILRDLGNCLNYRSEQGCMTSSLHVLRALGLDGSSSGESTVSSSDSSADSSCGGGFHCVNAFLMPTLSGGPSRQGCDTRAFTFCLLWSFVRPASSDMAAARNPKARSPSRARL